MVIRKKKHSLLKYSNILVSRIFWPVWCLTVINYKQTYSISGGLAVLISHSDPAWIWELDSVQLTGQMLFQAFLPFSKTLSHSVIKDAAQLQVVGHCYNTTMSLTERPIKVPEPNENLVCCICTLALPFQFNYALHYPEGEDCASNGHMSLRIGGPIIAITQGMPCHHYSDAAVYYVPIITLNSHFKRIMVVIKWSQCQYVF